MKKIVLTGAAGALGRVLRKPLAQMADALVSTDLVDAPDALNDGETWVRADLGRMDEIGPVMDGAEMVVHFGGIADESTWGDILHSNIIGTYNVYEAAFQAGARRVVYASSIHAMGMYPKTEFVPLDAPHRPDTYYGLSKCFAEDLARLYWEKRQMESVCLRILSAAGTPQNARAVAAPRPDAPPVMTAFASSIRIPVAFLCQLRRIPERIHLGQIAVSRCLALRGQRVLDGGNAAGEFGVRRAQGGFGVDLQMAGEVGHNEQQVPEFLFDLGL